MSVQNILNGLNGKSVYGCQNWYEKVSNFNLRPSFAIYHMCFLQSKISLGEANFCFDRSNSVCIFPFQMIASITEMSHEILKSTLIPEYIHSIVELLCRTSKIERPQNCNMSFRRLSLGKFEIFWENSSFARFNARESCSSLHTHFETVVERMFAFGNFITFQ